MHDDHIQGILFSKSDYLDLSPHSRRERFMLRLQATRKYLTSKRNHADVAANPLTVFKQNRLQKQHTAQVVDLLDRFKNSK